MKKEQLSFALRVHAVSYKYFFSKAFLKYGFSSNYTVRKVPKIFLPFTMVVCKKKMSILKSLKIKSTFITARKRSLGQGNIFSSVCQEFCPGGVSASVHAGIPPPPRHPPEQTPPCTVRAERYGQQAGSMHPTGMHSCLINYYRPQIKFGAR